MSVKEIPADELVAQFEYLDTLRATGVTNMFGAGRWLEDAFDIDRKTAGVVLSAWMETFDKTKHASERAIAAQESQP